MFGDRLKALRSIKKLRQEDIAEKLGIARTTYAMYEQEKREPDNDTLDKIADFFDTSVDYLLGRTDDPTPIKTKTSGGRAFFGGADQYTEEELDVARAAIEAYRKMKQKK